MKIMYLSGDEYTEDVTKADNFRQNMFGAWKEKSIFDENFAANELLPYKKVILYESKDGRTGYIENAVNFERIGDIYYEKR